MHSSYGWNLESNLSSLDWMLPRTFRHRGLWRRQNICAPSILSKIGHLMYLFQYRHCQSCSINKICQIILWTCPSRMENYTIGSAFHCCFCSPTNGHLSCRWQCEFKWFGSVLLCLRCTSATVTIAVPLVTLIKPESTNLTAEHKNVLKCLFFSMLMHLSHPLSK